MKKLGLIISALALVLGMSQCRKPVLPTYNGGTSTKTIEFTANYGGGEKGNFIENEMSHVLKYQWDNDATDGKTDKLYVFAQTGGETFTGGRYLGTLKITKVSNEGYTGHFFGKFKDVPNSGVLRFVHYGQGITVDETTGAASVDFSTQTGELADVSSKVVAICDHPYEDFSTELEISEKLIVQFAVAKLKYEGFGTDDVIEYNMESTGITVKVDGTIEKTNNTSVEKSNDISVTLKKPCEKEVFYTVFMPKSGTRYVMRNTSKTGYASTPSWTFVENKYYTDNGNAAVIKGNMPSSELLTIESIYCDNYTCKGVSGKVKSEKEAGQECEYGVVYAKKTENGDPTIGGEKCHKYVADFCKVTNTVVNFNAPIPDLEKWEDYCFKAYVIGEKGDIQYGEKKKFTEGGPLPLPDNWIDGKSPYTFSVKNDYLVEVYISQGNLQYLSQDSHAVATGGTVSGTWQFAKHQFDVIGADQNSETDNDPSKDRDLFGWGTSGYHQDNDSYNIYYQPYSTTVVTTPCHSTNKYGYGPSSNIVPYGPNYYEEKRAEGDVSYSYYDWGLYNDIVSGRKTVEPGWRVAHGQEFRYLIGDRKDKEKDKLLSGLGRVCCFPGMIILPDDWSWTTAQDKGLRYPDADDDELKFFMGKPGDFTPNPGGYPNVYTYKEWNEMEKLGAVFLPASGTRVGNKIDEHFGEYGNYWIGNHDRNNAERSYYMYFNNISWDGYNTWMRHTGMSVRLIKDKVAE